MSICEARHSENREKMTHGVVFSGSGAYICSAGSRRNPVSNSKKQKHGRRPVQKTHENDIEFLNHL